MARPEKTGIDYYPRDTGLYKDRKLRRARLEHGYLAVAVYELLLDLIYSDKGYYIVYNDESKADVHWELLAALQGPTPPRESDLEQIIAALADAGLFDPAQKERGVLTSRRIQETYYEVTHKRKYLTVEPALWLLSLREMEAMHSGSPILRFFINSGINPVYDGTNPANSGTGTQSKVKESKGNKRKDIASPDEKSSNEAGAIFISIPLNDNTEYDVPVLDVAHYKELYPAVDVEQELRGMVGWCEANPRNRKTRSGIKRFIASWLNKAQNQGGKGYGFHQGHPDAPGKNNPGGYKNPNVI